MQRVVRQQVGRARQKSGSRRQAQKMLRITAAPFINDTQLLTSGSRFDAKPAATYRSDIVATSSAQVIEGWGREGGVAF